MLESATSLLGPQAEAKNIGIDLDLHCSAEVTGDKDQLVQVFQNLLENAIKYGREDTKVTVLMQRADRLESRAAKRMGAQGVAVSVIDHGEGIPREHLPRLTERFYRVDTARSRELGGTGLGLAIVKHIVNRHRGALEVESTPGEGSTFTVFLPGETQETVSRRPATAAE